MVSPDPQVFFFQEHDLGKSFPLSATIIWLFTSEFSCKSKSTRLTAMLYGLP